MSCELRDAGVFGDDLRVSLDQLEALPLELGQAALELMRALVECALLALEHVRLLVELLLLLGLLVCRLRQLALELVLTLERRLQLRLERLELACVDRRRGRGSLLLGRRPGRRRGADLPGLGRRSGGLGRLLGLGALRSLALEHRAQAGPEAFLGLQRSHPKTLMMFNTAGPSNTVNIAGKMNMTVGNSILIGAFMAFSSAAA